MAMRLSGLMSGMDTESVIQQLVEARSGKVTTAKNAQTKLEWKQDIWKSLNSKLKTLQSKLNNMRFSGDYAKKTTKVSDSSIASILTSDNAMNGTQTLQVRQLAKTAYLTGGKILTRDEKLNIDDIKAGDLAEITPGETKSLTMAVYDKEGNKIKETELNITADTSITDIMKQMRETGIDADYDETQNKIVYHAQDKDHRIMFSGSGTGAVSQMFAPGEKQSTGTDVTALTKMGDLMLFDKDENGEDIAKKLTINAGDKKVEVSLTSETTISDLLNKMREAGLNANFDAKQERFFISAKDSGAAGNFIMTGDADALNALGLSTSQKAGSAVSGTNAEGREVRVTGSTKLDALMDFDSQSSRTLTLTKGDGSTVDIKLLKSTTVDEMLKQMKDNGINVTFDENQKKFIFDDSVAAIGGDSEAVAALGLDNMQASESNATFIQGQDAKIVLNGAEFTNNTNVFEINGLTITAQNETEPGKSITLTTMQDTDGIYDMIKDFFKTYNEVINEMDKLYNADSAKDYEPLSDDEKRNMSESEIEKYEQKIKDSLLRRDSSISSVSSVLKQIMLSGFNVNGKTMYLSNFGIETLNYFSAPENERNAYHINGDPDDESSSANEDKLKNMITSDPDAVISFFTQLSQKLYTEMNNQSKSVEGYRSFGSFYDDKKMKSDYDDYKSKIKNLEDKLSDYEDKWYKKFAKMETAMAKMQSNVSAVTSLLGGQ